MIVSALALLFASQVVDAPSTAAPAPALELWVSARKGDDQGGDGSAASPFRSLTRALSHAEQQAAARGLDIHLDMGEYSARHGERFPLKLPRQARIRGLTATYTVLDAGGADAAIWIEGGNPSQSRCLLDDFSIRNAATGVRVRGAGEVSLTAMLIRDCGVGVDVIGAPQQLELNVTSTRLRDCRESALRIQGPSESSFVRLLDSSLSGSPIGLHVATEGAGEGPALYLQRSNLVGHSVAGVLREGGPTEGMDRFEDCLIQGNRMGVEYRVPEGDRSASFLRCRFLENEIFGLRLVGREGGAADRTTIHECEFRWNGVGLQIVSILHHVEIKACRVLDNVGAGIFLSCYPAAQGVSGKAWAAVRECLIADNGSVGIQTHSDGRSLSVLIEYCTVANNRTSGIARTDKHKGTSNVVVKRCVVAGAAAAFENVPEETRVDCWTGLDPGFVDPGQRNYRLPAKAGLVERGAPERVVDLHGSI